MYCGFIAEINIGRVIRRMMKPFFGMARDTLNIFSVFYKRAHIPAYNIFYIILCL